ncbi:bacillithiol biosynthesis cysteine-adding enzyme BshC [Aneurinibacillus uraniidurans]|uniref:bacillithiol biosynthesis cysteine-adding enzyme BshC n=1 Tax=Aneurinibacillus uraniidurans TaxID=2966586 RepID=UPI002349B5A8|nr:bacillithiol biosynthesis cysteine-adding enzyme BshC [Aneurinibacillus sp. B1]WCN38981.1 bacillithiol biosynthesis cysteine-adding enzyme BshC [Aneurinibacillus sp. B1]
MNNVQIESVMLPFGQKIVHDYINEYSKTAELYPYHPYEQESYERRLRWLSEHPHANRAALADGLLAWNTSVGNTHERVRENIEALRQPDTYAVVTGQQAGVLTGPLYTIHKAITALRMAEEQQKRLGVRVVPIFWIAGEDHDYEEANHVYVQTKGGDVEKQRLNHEAAGRTSVTHLVIPQDALHEYIDAFFAEQIETEFTGDLKAHLHTFAKESATLTDFFARTLVWLFGEAGLILIDSAAPFVRVLEQDGFAQVIRRNEELNEAVAVQGQKLTTLGYHRQVETERSSAQFFLYRNGERSGVERLVDGTFRTRDGAVYTEEELLTLLAHDPESFSANVVTRPLMQEWLLPVLAFVGGPGEVAYWGLYARMFAVFGLAMPPVVPRLSFSLLEGAVQKNMRKFDLSTHDVLTKLTEKRDAYLAAQDTLHLDEKFAEVKQQMKELYMPLIEEASGIEQGLRVLGEKNLDKILEQVDFYAKRSQSAFVKKHESSLRQFDRIRTALFPMDKPQERVYNIFGYLNKYGVEWFREFRSYPYDVTSEHLAVRVE